LLIGQQPGNRRLLGQEFDRDGVIIGIRKHARQVTLVYLLLTLYFDTFFVFFRGRWLYSDCSFIECRLDWRFFFF
jgi:hypothetical protein